MTNNHLLLYRLAELMLEKQQHILPLDDLFEDEQIGSFVRSIQIDSPYQQLIFEGVLTETIKEERIMVSFTVEGYFHYVLGEVIEKQTLNKGAEALKELLENKQLRGITEGVEQCLVRDVEKDHLSRLMWLIDEGGKALEASTHPLAQAFLIHPIERVMDELLADPTDNDIEVLEKAIDILENVDKNYLIKNLYQRINILIKPKDFKTGILFTKSIRYIDPSERKSKLKEIENMTFINTVNYSKEKSTFLYNIGQQYLNISEYNQALIYLNKTVDIDKKLNGSEIDLAKCYNAIGNVYADLVENKNALKYFKKSYDLLIKCTNKDKNKLLIDSIQNIGISYLEINLEKSFDFLNESLSKSLIFFGKSHTMTSEAYYNLGVCYKYNNKYDEAIELYMKGLNIDLKTFDLFHPKIAQNYSNIGSAYYEKKDVEKSIFNIKKSLIINKRFYGVFNINTGIDFLNLGWIYKDIGDFALAKTYLINAKKIFKEIFNEEHEYYKITLEKLNELK